ncbi:heterokaryon incompatibility protein-domain-containing protein [Lasiosphaeris hirsuta]|uniref:Heterokaryon incompatibility protein-domain-containing protein n=1 Tax=Lasiosphaeris hirsuta TaxID=260670 RepID=A0AA40AYI2_9PEZI|nr:heterokaryon incompatibility protein-domain-containing protein [Lasiosphaeris hirsuta]
MPTRGRSYERSGVRQRRRAPAKHTWAIFKLWVYFAGATILYGLLSPSQNSYHEARVFFLLLSFIGSIMLATDNIVTVSLIFGHLLAGAIVFCVFSPLSSDDALGVAIAIVFAPLILGVGVFLLITVALLLWLVLTWLSVPVSNFPTVVYMCSFGRLVTRPPRFRNGDAFDKSRLCEQCQKALQGSSLLSGSWALVASAIERNPLHRTLEDMRRSWRGCHLCEALLGQKQHDVSGDDGDDEATPASIQSYGTMRPAQGPGSRGSMGNHGVFMNIRFIKGSLMSASESSFHVSLDTGCGTRFRTMHISEGALEQTEPGPRVFTGSDETLAKIKDWIGDCSRHKDCQPPDPDATFLPSRLLYVGTASAPELRLISTRSNAVQESNPRYMALSHCWGGDIACKLTTANHAAMREAISDGSLPKNFLHAIDITRRLGVPYLWIDSLCILQDSPSDWADESPTMGQVFAHAHCVVAATASENSSGGCFRNRPVPQMERNLMTSRARRCYLSTTAPSVRTLFDTRVETAPLTKRAWAFQERLLSRRLVHFCSDAVLFECNTMQASEYHARGAAYEKEPYAVQDGRLVSWFEDAVLSPLLKLTRRKGEEDVVRARRGVRGALDVLQSLGSVSKHDLAEKIEFCKRWFDIVSAYSEGALTCPTDKLIALSGVAVLVQSRAKAPYLAGLWASGILELQLLWMVEEPAEKQGQYCAPSWSWASVTGRIGLLSRGDLETTLLSDQSVILESLVQHVTVSYKDRAVTEARSLVDSGLLKIAGPAAVVAISKPKPMQRPGFPRPVPTLYFTGGLTSRFRASSLHFLPDSQIGDDEERSATHPDDHVVALHVMTVRHSEEIQHAYGLVLRRKRVSEYDHVTVYERLGVFWTADVPVHDRGPHMGGSPSAFRGTVNWVHDTVVIE